MANTVPITPPRVPLVDPRTGDVSRQWYRYFFSLYSITGSASGVIPVISGGTGLNTIPSNGQLLIGNGLGYTLNTLGAGQNIAVNNAAGNIVVAFNGILPIANGGTNLATVPTDGQLLIGNGSGYTLNPLTAGQNISIGNTAGAITVSFTGILPLLNGGTGANNATDARTNLGATTIGSNLFTLPDPSAVTFPRFNVDNTVSPLNATDFRLAIGAGTVASVSGAGSVNGITLTGTVTTSGSLTLGGALTGVNLTTQVSGLLPIANGGTGASTAPDARTNLGLGTMATQNTGATGTFLSGDLSPKTVTVVNGIITSIV